MFVCRPATGRRHARRRWLGQKREKMNYASSACDISFSSAREGVNLQFVTCHDVLGQRNLCVCVYKHTHKHAHRYKMLFLVHKFTSCCERISNVETEKICINVFLYLTRDDVSDCFVNLGSLRMAVSEHLK